VTARGKWSRDGDAWSRDPAKIALLRRLWADGVGTAEIAQELGTTKSAIAGKRRRLGLPERGNPCGVTGKRTGSRSAKDVRDAEARRARRAKLANGQHVTPLPAAATTIPPLASVAAPETDAGREYPPSMRAARSAPAFGSGHLSPPPPAARGPVGACAWPLDHPTRPGRFLACDAPSEPGRPYCPVHCKAAYQPRRLVPA
jgi:GcrA cell cycle regulator